VCKKEGTYIYDGSLAMGNLLNAAWSLGVGACWIHRAKEVFETKEGKEILAKAGITDDVEGIGFCILGKTNQEKDYHERRT
jgi:nitroreductase